eukprot:EG_transcript_4761
MGVIMVQEDTEENADPSPADENMDLGPTESLPDAVRDLMDAVAPEVEGDLQESIPTRAIVEDDEQGEPLSDGDENAEQPPGEEVGSGEAQGTDLGREKERDHDKKRKKEKKEKKDKKEKKEKHEKREKKRHRKDELAGEEVEDDTKDFGEPLEDAPPEDVPAPADELAPDALEEAATPIRLKKEKFQLSGKYAPDTTPGELVKEAPKPASAGRQPRTKTAAARPATLDELAEVKSQLLLARSEERWEDLKALLKGLLQWEPKMEDLHVTKLALLMSELKQIPQIEVFADIVLRMWKSLAIKAGLRPKGCTPLKSPTGSPSSVPSPAFPRSPVSLPVDPRSPRSHPEARAGTSPISPAGPPSFSLSEPPELAAAPTPGLPTTPSTPQPFAESEPQEEPTSSSSLPAISVDQEQWAFYKEESFEIHSSQPRNVMIRRLYNALLTRDENDSVEYLRPGSRNPRDVAVAIEEAIYSQHSGHSERVRHKFGQIFTNVTSRTNSGLRWCLLSGEVTPASLVQMRPEEMGTEEAKVRRQQSRDYARDAARAEWGEKRVTDTFKCSKCGHRKTTYFQMQTRSSDEPMTTFVTCAVCNNAWKF